MNASIVMSVSLYVPMKQFIWGNQSMRLILRFVQSVWAIMTNRNANYFVQLIVFLLIPIMLSHKTN